VGQAVLDAGYDRDFPLLAGHVAPVRRPRPAPGWRGVRLDTVACQVLVPVGVRLDLGATAKAVAPDRAADAIAAELGCGVLVELGGDVAVRGEAPRGGWLVGVGEDVRAGVAEDATIAVHDGGVATSSTTARVWRRGDGTAHHLVDPRSGEVAEPIWRAVSVAAATCLDANTASAAAIVLGADAPTWLADLRLPARLVGADGREVTVAGWPGQSRRGRP
jgi:thiamine biosynthesis lipoprotein